jgi:hypothetical protein
MEHLMASGTSPERVMYFSFDESMSDEPRVIDELMDTYIGNVLREDLNAPRPTTYVFLDEVQHIDHWQARLKRYYDLKLNLRFFVSGSASLNIRRKARESLAGRIYEFRLNPLSFPEFLALKGEHVEPFEELVLSFEDARRAYESLVTGRPTITRLFNEYVLKGGFPELVDKTSLDRVHEYIRMSVVDRVVHGDIAQEYRIREVRLLRGLMETISQNTGQTFDYEGLGRSLGASRQTVSNYVSYLEDSFLIRITRNHTGSMLASTRKAKKIYAGDHGISNAVMRNKESMFSEEAIGRIIETMVANHLGATEFWRRNREVDIILERDGMYVPVEVKYRATVRERELKGIMRFMESFGAERGLVITRDLLDSRKTPQGEIILVPAWLFLLSV